MKVLQLDKNHPLITEHLTANGFAIDEDITSSYEDILDKIESYEGVIIRSRIPLDARFLTQAKNLKWIARVGAGMENIDTKKAEELGICLFNSPEGNRDAVAEHSLGCLLVLMNRLFISSEEVKKGIWKREENRGEEIKDKTVGIIGYGNMGKALAQRLSGFGCEVIFHDIKPNLSDQYAQQVPLEILQEKADILSLHLPLAEDTIGWLNADSIQKMKKDFYLINTARGKNVVTADVVSALKSGKIKGACLDVLEYEKSSFENLEIQNEDLAFLLNSDKVIVTPHIAGWTHESKIKLAQVIVDKILAKFKK
ncbi:2-hydroxyacid dehydrogenase [Riemerella anatipestifer]|nr:2-hydroxyacid dehydrogenase [Riemerella anatipestifer]